MSRVFVIAEAGVNHNGSIKIAKKMIDVAIDARADAIKFQTFKAEKLVSKFAPKTEYQKKTTNINESQYMMIKRLELDIDTHSKLMNYCKNKGIIFLSSPFDLESIETLDKLGLETFKIPSGEITNLPYLRKLGSLNKKIIISTGMANLEEIRKALQVLIDSGTAKKNITILHCNTEYPTPFEDANLLAMCTVRDVFKVNVGYSDHTIGIEASLAAVALGATIIEKHFTLNRKMKGPDHKASLEPKELKAMVVAIRNIEKALGDGIKRASVSESKNISIIRKSIVAARHIKTGEVFSEENMAIKRPGDGISPMDWDKVIGKIAKKNFKVDEFIEI